MFIGGVVFWPGRAIGDTGRDGGDGALRCVRIDTGRRRWQSSRHGNHYHYHYSRTRTGAGKAGGAGWLASAAEHCAHSEGTAGGWAMRPMRAAQGIWAIRLPDMPGAGAGVSAATHAAPAGGSAGIVGGGQAGRRLARAGRFWSGNSAGVAGFFFGFLARIAEVDCFQ